MHARTERRSSAVAPLSISARNSVGTPGSTVGRVRRSAARIIGQSKRGSMTISPPFASAALSATVIAKMWKNGMTASVRSSPSRRPGFHAFTCRRLAQRLAWVSIAPFGEPVVPPVYCSAARSSGARGIGFASGGLASRWPSSTTRSSPRGTAAMEERRSTRNAMAFAFGSACAKRATTTRFTGTPPSRSSPSARGRMGSRSSETSTCTPASRALAAISSSTSSGEKATTTAPARSAPW